MANEIGRRSYNVRSGRIIPNVLPRIILVDNNIQDAGYLAFISKLKAQNTKQEKVTWDVDEFLPIIDTVDGAVSSTTQTTIKVDNPTYFIPGQLWQVKRTKEVLYVKEVNNSTQYLTVKRAVSALNSSGGTAAAAIDDGDQLNRIAPAVSENSSRQVYQSTTPSEVFNFCQIFRADVSFSDRQIKREMVNDNDYNYNLMKAMKEMRMDLNRAHLFGQRARYYDDQGDDVTLMNGIENVISTNTWSVGGTLYRKDLDEFLMEEGLRYGAMDKVVFASTDVLLAIHEIAASNTSFQIPLVSKGGVSIGIHVIKYLAPNGARDLFVEDRNITVQRNGEAYGADMNQLIRRVFSNNSRTGELHSIANTQDNDDVGRIETILGDMTMTYGSEKHHFKLTNVSGGAWSSPNA